MAILLDSHTFVWWVSDDSKLSSAAKRAIEEESGVFVSAVVAWELSTKVRLGKWRDAEPIVTDFFRLLVHYGFDALPITVQHGHLAGLMRGAHRDPFDRMLAAQAEIEDMPLVSADPAFRAFAIRVLW